MEVVNSQKCLQLTLQEVQHHKSVSEPFVNGETWTDKSGRHSLLLHFTVLDGLAVEDLREPVEDWVQNEGPNLYPLKR